MSDRDELARRRGLFFPSNEAYGGTSGFYTYGPAGTALKRAIEGTWRERFVTREGHHEVASPSVVPEPVFEASGHCEAFDDLLVACPDCDRRHRADHLVEDATDIEDAEDVAPDAIEDLIATHGVECPDCLASLSGQPVTEFGLMFETTIGPGDDRTGYLRPETAQGTLVEFPRLAEYARGQLPFGVAQVGRGYRNEISPRNAIVRMRELTMAELQAFHHPASEPPIERVSDVSLRLYPTGRQAADETEYVERTAEEAAGEAVTDPWLAYYLGVTCEWLGRVGVDPDRLRCRAHREGELAHYAEECWDPEVEIDGEWIEVAGVANRADHDLANHAAATEEEYAVFEAYDEPRTVEEVVVDADMGVLGPEFGDRAPAVLEALESLAREDPEALEADSGTVSVALDADGPTTDVPADAVEVRVEEREQHGEHRRPHVVEPAIGIDRVVYATIAHNHEEDIVDGEERTRLALPPEIAPTLVAVFPLTDENADRARALTNRLRRRGLDATDDDSGSIGRRYRRQDEVGTPYCVTLDERTPEDGTATLRERDSTEQVRIPLSELPTVLAELRAGETTFADLD
jgi:glycyl-tRNA synthetase